MRSDHYRKAKTMQIKDSVALVTGSNRGIGSEWVRQLGERGARTIYATARDPRTIDLPGVTALALDITDRDSVAAVAARATDVDLLINNAGISTYEDLVGGDLERVRLEMETHFFGTLRMIRAFAPLLGANGGGAILNVLSALSFRTYPGATAYGAAKAAEWSLTDGARIELAEQGTLVTGLHVGAVDTEMMAGWDIPKVTPAEVVAAGLDAIEAGRTEVLVDDTATQAKESLGADPRERYAAAGLTLA
jgi:NAD(P)-dependent dehydrogenase (short-subunit alcohol dehydrogenase family)